MPDEQTLRKLATTDDMYERLVTTIGRPDIDPTVAKAVTLQLTGAPDRDRTVGADVRGDIHLCLIAGSGVNLSRFLSVVRDLTPVSTDHLNGVGATKAGALGSTSGGSIDHGPILDPEVEYLTIEAFDDVNSNIITALEQVLDTGQFTVTQASMNKTVDAPGSILIGSRPKYGSFDEYEPISDQLNLTPSILNSVDLPIVNISRNYDYQIEAPQLPPDHITDFMALARQLNPAVTTDTTDIIDRYIADLEEYFGDKDYSHFISGPEKLRNSIIRFAAAHARLRLDDETSRVDGERAVELVKTAFADIGLDPEVGQYDADVIEKTPESPDDDELGDLIESIIYDLEKDHEDGAPIDEVLEKTAKLDIEPEVIEHEIEKLKQKGNVYEPRTDHLRTT